MARDSLTPEGDTVTTKFTKKLHTLHMCYRSLWSTKDRLEAVVLVIAPDTKMGAVVNFVSNMELLFPSQQQYTRKTLDPLEVRRLAKGVEGPFSSMKVKTPAATRTGSQSGSTTRTLNNTKFENKLGELEAGMDEIGGIVGEAAVPISKFGKMLPLACVFSFFATPFFIMAIIAILAAIGYLIVRIRYDGSSMMASLTLAFPIMAILAAIGVVVLAAIGARPGCKDSDENPDLVRV